MSSARAYYCACEDGEGYREYRESLTDHDYEADSLADADEAYQDSQW
jgi:hypothetical protein